MQMLNIARLKLLKICACYCIRREDGKEHNDELIHSVRLWKGCLWFSMKILRAKERNGEQEKKLREGLFERLLVHLWL